MKRQFGARKRFEKRVGNIKQWGQSTQTSKAITHRNGFLVQLDVQHSLIKHNSFV